MNSEDLFNTHCLGEVKRMCLPYSQEIIQSISDFYCSSYSKLNKAGYGFAFKHMFDCWKIESLAEITSDIVIEQIIYIKSTSDSPRAVNALLNYYKFLLDSKKISLTNITIEMLNRKKFVSWLMDGYRPYVYSPYVQFPSEDKIIIDFSTLIEMKGSADSQCIVTSDTSKINNDYLKNAYKSYFWYSQKNISARNQFSHVLPIFIKVVESEYDSKTKPIITAKMIQQFNKEITQKTKNKASLSVYKSFVRTFIEHAIDEGYVSLKNKNDMIFLESKETHTKGDTRSYTKEQLDSIIDYFKKRYDESEQDSYLLCMWIVMIQMKTALRAESICSLKADCLVKVDKIGYDIRYSAKYNKDETSEISTSTANVIKRAIAYTKDLRSTVHNKNAEYLFLYVQNNTRNISRMSRVTYSRLLNEASENLDLPSFGQTGIRNFFYAAETIHNLRKSKDMSELVHLSKHSLAVHFNNYVDSYDIYKVGGDFYNVDIGDVDLQCDVEEKYNSDGSDTVMNGAGYCGSKECNYYGLEDCMFCNNFITTISHQKDFENIIARLDKEIEKETIPHEKEFLIWRKKGAVKVLCRIIELKNEILGIS